jgi:autotransporter-associated beta strand protein
LTTSGLDVNFDTDLAVVQSAAATWNNDSGDLIFNGQLAGSGAITLASGGVRFNTACLYSGTLTINSLGHVTLGTANALSNATVKIDVNDGLNLNGGGATLGGLAGSGNLSIGSNTLTVRNTNVSVGAYSGTISGSVDVGSRIVKADGGMLLLTGGVSNVNAIDVTGGDVFIVGATVTLNEPLASGSIILSGGDMVISGGANVSLSAPSPLGGVVVINSRELVVDQAQLICGRIASNAGGIVRLGDEGTTPALVIGKVGSASTSSTFAGTFTNAGSPGTIRKVGDGTLTLNTSHTNTGGVDVMEGAIAGTGRVRGTTTIHSGAAIRPGNSAGVFTVQHAMFDAGSSLDIELGGATFGSQHDLLYATGDVVLGGTLNLSYINSFTASPGDSFVVLKANSISGQFDNVVAPDGQTWNVVYNNATGTVSVNVCSSPDSGDCLECADGEPLVENINKKTLHTTIQAAINAADSGNTLELSACVFYERGLTFGGKTLTLRGQGRDATVIDGESLGQCIVFLSGSSNATIESLTVRNGLSNDGTAGGGINVVGGAAAATLRNVALRNNLGFSGGAIFCDSGTIHVEQCVMEDNSTNLSGGGAAFHATRSGIARFINCLFAGDSTNTRLVYARSSDGSTVVEFTNCTFADFTGNTMV